MKSRLPSCGRQNVRSLPPGKSFFFREKSSETAKLHFSIMELFYSSKANFSLKIQKHGMGRGWQGRRENPASMNLLSSALARTTAYLLISAYELQVVDDPEALAPNTAG